MNPLTTIKNWLTEQRAIAEAATEGPLKATDESCVCLREVASEKDKHFSVFDSTCGNLAHVFNQADAKLFATARTSLPQALAALETAVEEVELLINNKNCPMWIQEKLKATVLQTIATQLTKP